uniref:Uncharacterized protein TCIL3000_11_14260 n=1 Tax=Trypanosoma congolense (strain IL3000) TaxID=1068625 RepID=G0V2N9_TRYCI|nr:unnamed protein product [Trypanosoma congolense IL3000]
MLLTSFSLFLLCLTFYIDSSLFPPFRLSAHRPHMFLIHDVWLFNCVNVCVGFTFGALDVIFFSYKIQKNHFFLIWMRRPCQWDAFCCSRNMLLFPLVFFRVDMLRSAPRILQRGERGLYFPINHRIVDQRIAPGVTVEQADVQSRYRRELRTSFTTGETRQTIPPPWSARVRPTHFVAFRLPVKNTLARRVKEMHEQMVFSHPHCAPLLVPLAKLHMTLGVMTIAEAEREEVVKRVGLMVSEVFAGVPLMRLRFRGLGTFGHGRVLFIRVMPEGDFSRLERIACEMRRQIGGRLGVDIKGNPYDSYVPHVTVAKIRTNQGEKFGNKIPQTLWADYQHNEFGDVTFSTVDFCRMEGSADGYYCVESSVPLS